ncbi:MAG: hypothetical protein JWQ03_1619, partial [Variovorax sp.]|nr:hypothetical protein [Variovorax sp.]
MNDRFPRKPTILSAAISTQLAVVELKGAERRAALQIPIKQAVRDLGRDLAKELDDN